MLSHANICPENPTCHSLRLPAILFLPWGVDCENNYKPITMLEGYSEASLVRLYWISVTRHLLSRRCNKTMQEEDFWLGCTHVSRQDRIFPQLFLMRLATNSANGPGWSIYLPQLFSVTTRRWEASFLLATASSPRPCTPHPLRPVCAWTLSRTRTLPPHTPWRCISANCFRITTFLVPSIMCRAARLVKVIVFEEEIYVTLS